MRKFLIISFILIFYLITRKQVENKVTASSTDKNVLAFLAMIRQFESGGDYAILYGGGHFDSFDAHPNVRVPFHNPLKSTPGNNDYSTAAGAYQINWPTWLTIQAGAFLPDFSPASQDQAAIWLLQYRGALDDVRSGNFDAALATASKTWASLPGSTAGQNPVKYDRALAAYQNNGGTVA